MEKTKTKKILKDLEQVCPEKMSFDEYWSNVVGKVAELTKEIQAKYEEQTKFLLDIIEHKLVIPEA
jgi:flagellar hook-associated protein FlgK